jgi:prefoldin subunit 5
VAPSTPPLGAKQIVRSPTRTPSPTKLPGSPTKPHNVPRSALHISILRSQLVGLQTRHRNLQYNLVKRSGAILDKMIDQAGRLKDLGGVDGPLEEDGQRQHAIPDALIDLQEELEARATDIGDRVTWCSSFEQQCRKGHDHFSRSARAGKAGSDFLAEIKSALAQPPTSHKHSALQQMFAEASSALPPPLDAESLPMPSHPAFPSKDDHNEAVFAALSEARSDAEVDLDLGGKMLAYYGQLLRAWEALQAQHARVQVLREHLQQAIRQLEMGSNTAPRPTLDGVASNGGDHSEWLQNIASWTDEGDMATRAATDAHETTVLAVMQYRKALSSATMAVKPHLPPGGVPDDLGPLVDDDSQDLIALGKRCSELAKRARSDADAVPLVLSIREANTEIADGLRSLRSDVVRAVNLAAWSPRSPSALPTTLTDDLAAIKERASEFDRDMQRLRAMPSTSDAIAPLESAFEQSKDSMAEACQELDVFRRVSAQAKTVRDLQAEATRLVEQLEAATDNLPEATPDASDSILADLRNRVTEWNDNIIPRVGLVSGQEPSSSPWSPDGERSTSHGPLTPPLTPVDRDGEPSGFMSTMPDLIALDKRVRSEVNHQSARVMASMARLSGVHDRLAYERWAAPVRSATESLEAAKEELQTTLSGLMNELGHLNNDNQSSRHEHAVESIRTGAEAIGKHAACVQSLVAKLNDVLGADASAGIDMRKAADVFSSADITREAALEQITKAEKWQRQLEDIVAQSLLARSVTPVARKSDDVPRTPEQVAKKVKSLAGGLDALDLEAIVHPSPAQLRATPKRRRLPSSTEAKQLTKAFSSIADKARSIARSQPNSPELKKLLDKVTSQGSLVPDLEGLAEVADAAAVCDDAFSRLLDTVDARAGRDATRAAENEAKAAVETLQHLALPLLGDSRVALERRRVSNTWKELRAVAEEDSVAGTSTTGSSATVSERRPKPRLPPNPATAARRTRTNSMFSSSYDRGTPTPSRVLSDTTQARVRRTRPSLDSAPFTPKPPSRPRSSLPSSISMPGRPIPRAITPTVPVPFKLSISRSTSRLSRSTSSSANLASLAEASTPTRPRTRFGSEPPSMASVPRKPKFKPARERSTLDAAVQNVLKELDVS